MCSQNNIKATDVLTNLWHMFVYSGFPCPQFSRLCSPEDLSVFTKVRVNTGGEIGINSQRSTGSPCKSFLSIPENAPPSLKLLSPTPPLFLTLTEMGEKQTLMEKILRVWMSQRPAARTSAHFRGQLSNLHPTCHLHSQWQGQRGKHCAILYLCGVQSCCAKLCLLKCNCKEKSNNPLLNSKNILFSKDS